MTFDHQLRALRSGPVPKANSLMVTVFGDTVAPRGVPIWLGSLINLVAPLGLNERLVRTAVNRLAKDDWLGRRTVGRRAFYGLSAAGQARFESATERIYAPDRVAWNGRWCLVVTAAADLAPARREALKKDLAWQGFGAIAPGVFAHPMPELDSLAQVLADYGLTDRATIFDAQAPGDSLRHLVGQSWNLSDLEKSYTTLVERFAPLHRALGATGAMGAIAPEHAFVTRSLLIHEYRRAILRDPLLPDALLPKDWPGTAARALCRALYRRIWQAAETYVETILETVDGSLPAVSPNFYRRFGGLVPRVDNNIVLGHDEKYTL